MPHSYHHQYHQHHLMVSLILYNILAKLLIVNQTASCTGILSAPSTHQNSATVTMYTSMSGSAEDSIHPQCRCEAAVGVLGSLVGLLLVLLTVVSISLVWTCWNMKKSVRYMQRPYYITGYALYCIKGIFEGENL